MIKLAGQGYSQNTVSKCAARAQQPVGIGRSSDSRSLVKLKRSRKKSLEKERGLAKALHNVRSAKKLDDRSVAGTVFASRRVSVRTGLSQLMLTCALAMLLLASLHGVAGGSITTRFQHQILCTPARSVLLRLLPRSVLLSPSPSQSLLSRSTNFVYSTAILIWKPDFCCMEDDIIVPIALGFHSSIAVL